MDFKQFEDRKRDHLRLALDPVHQASENALLDRIELVHEALPDLDFAEVTLTSKCLGELLPTPFFIAGMTAGHADAPEINRVLALAAQARGWAMGVGSQRRELEEGSSDQSSDQWVGLRRDAPRLKLFSNVGISQLSRYPLEKFRGLVDSLGAQALVVHANALQEVLQIEGTPNFKGALGALERLCRGLGVPVILKETGCGFSDATLTRLNGIGLAAIDVSGRGGTHWGRIEGARAEGREGGEKRLQASRTFENWGIPTPESVLGAVRCMASGTEIWASGGVRSGLDAAKLIALGAHRVGYAQPALQAALNGEEALNSWMEQQEFELRIALFCTGSGSVENLRAKESVWNVSGH